MSDSENNNKKARVLIFTGDGKGKTTAALGMALRAAGHGLNVCIIQFVKNDSTTGEISALAHLPKIRIEQMGLGFVGPDDDGQFAAHKAAAQKALDFASDQIVSGRYELVILDEVCFALQRGLLSERQVLEIIQTASPQMRLVLTGRGASEKLIAAADTVTQMQCVKHGMESGISAQKGVEF